MQARHRVTVVAAMAAAGLLLALPMSAQYGETTGGIHGKVVDEQGGVLPGASVTQSGPGAAQTILTDALGEFHFLRLSPGVYTLVVVREGFATVDRSNITVAVGRDTELTIAMKISTVAATVTVTSEAPVVDTRGVATGASISYAELQDIPTARDPWVILQGVPGVLIDRVNVGGSESGQQSGFTSKGSFGGTFTVDGVNTTDMSGAIGTSVYYDFDSFQEMSIITGGSDPSIQGANAHISMVTKRGTNEVHGSARLFAASDKLESNNLTTEEKLTVGQGNHIDNIQDFGAELGGPLVQDHLWLWGAYGRDQINLTVLGAEPGGERNDTTLEDLNGKLNAQIIASNSFNAWYLGSNKLVFGRGADPTRPQPTTWDTSLPNHDWKFEDSQVFSSSLFASAQYNGSNGDFTLTPEGGLGKQVFYDADAVWHNSYLFYSSPRPQRQAKFDASYFFSTGDLGHELKAGFSYLNAQVRSLTAWPAFGPSADPSLALQTNGDLTDCSGDTVVPCAVITRNGSASVEAKYYSVYLGDTITLDRLTVNLGVRWDEQYGFNRPSAIPANPTFPGVMPALNYPGRPKDFEWNNWQPRFGVTYALGQNRTTVLKASYAQFADALGTNTVSIPSPVFGASYAWYGWNDANHDNLVQPSEVDLNDFQFSFNRNDANPGDPIQVTNGLSRRLNAPATREIIAGFDHELSPNFAIGVNYTYRKATGQLYSPVHVYDPTTGQVLNTNDYEQYTTVTGTLPNGQPYSAPVYQIKQSVLERLGLCSDVGTPDESCSAPSGSYTFNRGDYNETYSGVELVFTKRLSNRWMARGSFVYNDNVQHLAAGGCIDPTNLATQNCRNDDLVAEPGFRGSVYLNAKWQFAVNGLYQLPYNFTIAANVYGHQGYPIDWFRNVGGAVDGRVRSVSVVPVGSQRYGSVFEVDMQVGYVVRIFGSGTMALTAACFNVPNSGTILQRQSRLGLGNTNDIFEIQSPRVARFGAQISF